MCRHYKLPSSHLLTTSLPVFPLLCVYAGDFNCQHVQRRYKANTSNRECLVEWITNNNLMLLHNPKGAASFTSGCWNTGTDPDLAFASARPDNGIPDRCVLEKFPWSQNRPSLNIAAKLMDPIPSGPVKRWNFHKADRNHYRVLANEAMQTSTSSNTTNVEETYKDFCSAIIKAAKISIPQGCRNNYIPCWDKECGSVYHAFLNALKGKSLAVLRK